MKRFTTQNSLAVPILGFKALAAADKETVSRALEELPDVFREALVPARNGRNVVQGDRRRHCGLSGYSNGRA